MSEIEEYSNMSKVISNAKRILRGKSYQLELSTRKDKKYMIKFSNDDKWIHFGQMGYEDYTYHNNPIRRNRFLKRNIKWSKQDYNTPGFLSYYLLW